MIPGPSLVSGRRMGPTTAALVDAAEWAAAPNGGMNRQSAEIVNKILAAANSCPNVRNAPADGGVSVRRRAKHPKTLLALVHRPQRSTTPFIRSPASHPLGHVVIRGNVHDNIACASLVAPACPRDRTIAARFPMPPSSSDTAHRPRWASADHPSQRLPPAPCVG